MVACVVGNRGGRAAMLRGWGGKRFGWLRGTGKHMDHPLAQICGTMVASQSENHFLCWRQLARELRLNFCLLSAHLL